MKKTIKIVCLLLALVVTCTCFLFACETECEHEFDSDGVCTLCGENKCDLEGHTWHNGECIYDGTASPDFVDYVSQLKFVEGQDGRAWTKVKSVKNYIDGDTTHFNVDYSVVETGVLKARYLAVNTPESTGTVEPYGKVASNFTKEKLSTATEIILESDNSTWNVDSTGTRYTVWIWYRPASGADLRNLNLELLQEGLALASNSSNNCYGTYCSNAIKQSQELKFRVYDSSVPDETFYYGDAIPLTLKELRSNVSEYAQKKVQVDGVVVLNSNNGVYIEEYDEMDDISYGMYVYYGFTKNTRLISNLSVGNKVRVVGTVSEFYGTYQISGVDYRALYPNDPDNTIVLEDGKFEAKWKEMTIDEFYAQQTITIEGGDDKADYEVTNDYAYFAQATSIYMKDLIVDEVYTTRTMGSDSRGAMSITCHQAGSTAKIVIRTGVLRDPDGRYGIPENFLSGKPTNNTTDFPEFTVLEGFFHVGKVFSIYGVVGYYENEGSTYNDSPYQINVFSLANFVFA